MEMTVSEAKLGSVEKSIAHANWYLKFLKKEKEKLLKEKKERWFSNFQDGLAGVGYSCRKNQDGTKIKIYDGSVLPLPYMGKPCKTQLEIDGPSIKIMEKLMGIRNG